MLGLEVDFLPPFCFGWKHVLFWYFSCRQQPPTQVCWICLTT